MTASFPPGLPRMDAETLARLEFEDAFAALQEIVARLDAGGLTVSQSVALYELGVRLARQCNQRLDEAELRVRSVHDLPVTDPDDDTGDD